MTMLVNGYKISRKLIIAILLLLFFFFTLVKLHRQTKTLSSIEGISYIHYDDVKRFLRFARDVGMELTLFDPVLLEAWEKNVDLHTDNNCVFLCHVVGPLSFAMFDSQLSKLPIFLQSATHNGFTFTQFFHDNGKISHIFFTRYGSPMHVTVLYWETRAGYLRQYALAGKPHNVASVKEFITVTGWNAMSLHRAFEMWKGKRVTIDGADVMIPNDINEFNDDYFSSHFIPCNTTRATYYMARYPEIASPETRQFEHAAWKLLAKAKVVLDQLRIPFWLSSGTCLGFFRECKFIPWSLDVDLGVFIADYNPNLIEAFEKAGLKLNYRFGNPEDSFELSFREKDIKLDIFFFYSEGATMWNGGTQLKTGKKFKYVFPNFTLCWADFLNLKVRVPCQTEQYVEANYGKRWFEPIQNWDWKKSPNNVRENGVWDSEVRLG